MSDLYKIKRLEAGLFAATSWPRSPSEERSGLVRVPGLPVDLLKFWRHQVQSDSGQREHLTVMVHYPALAQGKRDAIVALLRSTHPGAIISLARNYSAVEYCEPAAESYVEESAAAMAAIEGEDSWFWIEGEVFEVRVGSRAFDVTLWTGKETEAQVCERVFEQSDASDEARTSSDARQETKR